jgi:hypothetical protein
MARYVNNGTGSYSTVGLWDTITNTPTIHATTNITISTTNLYTVAYQAANIADLCTGCIVYVVAAGTTGGNISVTHQEDAGLGFADILATATVAYTDQVANTWLYFRFGTPHSYTTAAAGKQRFRIVNSVASATITWAADSVGSNISFLASDNRHPVAAPGSGDDLWICGQNAVTTKTVTMDGAQTCGSRGSTAAWAARNVTNAVSLCQEGTLSWDTAASATLTCRGNLGIYGEGTWAMGSAGVCYPTGKVATLTFSPNAAGDHGVSVGAATAVIVLNGEPKTTTSLWKSYYSSGVGTAADPMVITTDTDWAVNDELVICPSSDNATNYAQTEKKFIKTIATGTTYVLSDTAGGGEAALSYTHPAADVLNITRNIIVNTDNAAKGWYLYPAAILATGQTQMDWVRFEYCGDSSTGTKYSLYLGYTGHINCNYSVNYNPLYYGVGFNSGSTTRTHTGLIIYNTTSGYSLGTVNAPKGVTVVDCFWVKNSSTAYSAFAGVAWTLTRCKFIGQSNSANGSVLITSSPASCVFTDCEFHCSRGYGLTAGGTAITYTTCLFGTKGVNQTYDIRVASASYIENLYDRCTFESPALISNYLNLSPGSILKFHRKDTTEMNHLWYTPSGIARSTGAAPLPDTNVRTAGSYALRLAPEDTTDGLVYEFFIVAKASSAVSISGFIQKNAAFGTDVCTVELWLPDSSTANATMNMPDDTNWNVFSLYANYTGTLNKLAKVRIIAKTVAASAYCYVDDIYNGTNVVTALDVWYNAQPATIMFEQLGDATAVWGVLTSALTVVGSVGLAVVTNLDAKISDVPTDAENATAVWAKSTAGLTTANTTGKKLVDGLTTGKFVALS